jgi:hypothetical protein
MHLFNRCVSDCCFTTSVGRRAATPRVPVAGTHDTNRGDEDLEVLLRTLLLVFYFNFSHREPVCLVKKCHGPSGR